MDDVIVIGAGVRYIDETAFYNVKKLQKCLTVLGYYKGAIDGDYGPGTTSAVKKLQKAKKLAQDGIASKNVITVMFGGTAQTETKPKTERLDWFH